MSVGHRFVGSQIAERGAEGKDLRGPNAEPGSRQDEDQRGQLLQRRH